MEAKIKINISTGEVDISGSEDFVLEQMELAPMRIKELTEALGYDHPQRAVQSKETVQPKVGPENLDKKKTELNTDVEFGVWRNMFEKTGKDVDDTLIVGYYEQKHNTENDFKSYEVRNRMKEFGIKVNAPSDRLRNLKDSGLVIQTRREGRTIYYRVSEDGQSRLKELLKEGKNE